MSINVIHLNKLLKLMYIPDNELISELRSDIRSEIGKESGQDSGGGHFYMPFWSDVKNHVLGKIDLTEATKARIASNKNMANLYPLLEKGFLNLWKRGDNQTVTVIEKSPKGTYKTDNDLTVKVENIIC
mgnify:CR=1 FL=1